MTVRLTWELPAIADAVEVYRSTSTINPNSPGVAYAVLAGDAVLYDDAGTEQFTRYYYRVAVRVTGFSPDGFAITSDEVVIDTYDSSVTDPLFENVALLFRFDGELFTDALPLNEGYAAIELANRYSPTRMFSTTTIRKHYQTSLAVNAGAAWLGESPVPNLEVGCADAFGSISMDAWIYKASTSNGCTIFSSKKSSNFIGLEFQVTSAEVLRIYVGDAGGFAMIDLSSAVSSVPLDEWVHVAAVRDGTRNWELFINGASVATGSQTGAGADANELILGVSQGFSPQPDWFIDSARFDVGVARYTAPFTPGEFYSDVVSPQPVSFSATRGTPYLVAAGTRNANNTAASAPFPASYQEGDLLLLQIRNDANGGVVPSPPTGGGWVLIGSFTTSENAAVWPQLRHTLYYKIASASENTSPVVPDASGTIHVRISIWRGVTDVGSPIGAISETGDPALNLPYLADGITTLNENSAVLLFSIASDNISLTDDVNPDLFDYQEAYFDANTSGDDGTQQCMWGIKIGSGAVQDFTGTKSSAQTDSHFVIELRGKKSTDVATPVAGAAALAVPSGISLGGNGLTGTFVGSAALSVPPAALEGTGAVVLSIPTYRSTGTFANSINSDITPGLPAGYEDDDILLLHTSISTFGASPDPTLSIAGWTLAVREYSRLIGAHTSEIWWKRASGVETAPLVPHSGGDFIAASITAILGCKKTGSPFDATSTFETFSDDNEAFVNGLTTTVDDCLFLAFSCTNDDAISYQWNANADLDATTEGFDYRMNTASGDTTLSMAYGRKLTAGTIGQTTAGLFGVVRTIGLGLAMSPV